MSDERDPETDQVAPVPNDGPSCHDLVIADMAERKEFGLRKYKSLLQPNNGRSMLQDAYEEVLDLAVYLRGAVEEERQKIAVEDALVAEVEGHIFNRMGLCEHPDHWAGVVLRSAPCWKANLNAFMRGM